MKLFVYLGNNKNYVKSDVCESRRKSVLIQLVGLSSSAQKREELQWVRNKQKQPSAAFWCLVETMGPIRPLPLSSSPRRKTQRDALYNSNFI